MEHKWPYETADVDPVPGAIKERYEDFTVEEIPAYEPCGTGDHVYFLMEKQGLSTPRAIRDVARELGVRPGNMGIAGIKDARGVTRQWVSVEHVEPSKLQTLNIPRIQILNVCRHRNKLKMGHLKGNRFTVKLRHTDTGRIDDVRALLERLYLFGIPNYFGLQRFGNRGDTWRIGASLLAGDFDDATGWIAGRPGPDDEGEVLRARELFQAGEYGAAARAWPNGFHECVLICRNMEKFGGDHRKSVLQLDRKSLGFYVSAYQSWLFNKVLASRIDRLGMMEDGDLAWKHDSGAVFLVEDAAVEQPRADRFEISPTGPLFGLKMKIPGGDVGDAEMGVLSEAGVALESFPKTGPLRCPGGRRALRFRGEGMRVDVGDDEHGAYLEVGFSLPPGCYATSLFGEICKDRLISL